MTTISDLSEDLAVEILSKVPLTSLRAVRSTCKTWNALSKNQIFGKAATARNSQFLGFTVVNFRVWSIKLDLQGTRNDSDFVDISIKQRSINQLSIFNQVEIAEVFHCNGLLLCVTTDETYTRLVLWNPYLGETRWIQPRKNLKIIDMYAFGYDNNNRNHKILRLFYNAYVGEIYDCNTNSWTVLDFTPKLKIMFGRTVSLKGNAYLMAVDIENIETLLFSFDFTAEKFGPRLPLPSDMYSSLSLSRVRDEQLALLYETSEILEIWITWYRGASY